MSTDLSPTSKTRALTRLRGYLPALSDRFEPEQLAYLDTTLAALAKAQHRTVVFRYLGQVGTRDRFELGYEGQELRVVETALRGVWAVWWCLDTPDQTALRASDLVAPHADAPEQSVRKMLRTTAAAQFARWGVPELEAAAKTCTVNAGIVTCERPAHAAKVMTR